MGKAKTSELTMGKAKTFELYMIASLITTICMTLFAMPFTGTAGQIAAGMMTCTLAMFAFAYGAIKELKKEITSLKSDEASD